MINLEKQFKTEKKKKKFSSFRKSQNHLKNLIELFSPESPLSDEYLARYQKLNFQQ